MSELTKKKLKELMLKVLNDQDATSKDEWYATDQTFARFGIQQLADELNIKLYEKEDDNE